MPRTIARRYRHAALGSLLALGAPLGLVILRAAGAQGLSSAWLVQEVAGQAGTYLYVTLSTALVFSTFGYVLGRQSDRLQEMARTDPLTSLLNRRAFHERFEEEFARAVRYRLSLSLLLLDLDALKSLNDREGHRQGDAALRGTARALRVGSRITDITARWGGDEFVVLAPNTARDEAVRLADRIRGAVAAEDLAGLTVSIGVTTLDPGCPLPGPEALMSEADGALYVAKKLGRNRVVVC